MKELTFFVAVLLVLSGCLSSERPANASVNNTCTLGTCQTQVEGVNSSLEASAQNPLSERTDDITPMQQSLDKLNEDIRNARLNRTPDNTAILTTTLAQKDSSGITQTTAATAGTRQLGDDYDHVEVIHFHGNSQCSTCRAVGAYAEETVNTYFSDELKSGKLLFGHVNYDLPENKALAEKYGVTGSSLWIGTYKGGKFYPEENTNVWYKINNKADYMGYLNSVIAPKLIGL